MNKRKICLLLITMFVFLFKIDVNAANTCTIDEQKVLQIEAKNIIVNYELSRPENDNYISAKAYFYTIIVENMTENLYLKIGSIKYDISWVNKDGTIILEDIFMGGGINANINIYSRNANCPNVLLRTVDLKLPYYNPYSEREECKGLTAYKICEKNSNTEDIDEDTFLKKIEEAKKVEEEKNKPQVSVEEDKNVFTEIIDFVKANYKTIIIVIFVLVILSVSLVMYIKKKNKNKIKIDLEK